MIRVLRESESEGEIDVRKPLDLGRAHSIVRGLEEYRAHAARLDHHARLPHPEPAWKRFLPGSLSKPLFQSDIRFPKGTEVPTIRGLVHEACDLVGAHMRSPVDQVLFDHVEKVHNVGVLGEFLAVTDTVKPESFSNPDKVKVGGLYHVMMRGSHTGKRIIGICIGFAQGEPYFEADPSLIGVQYTFGRDRAKKPKGYTRTGDVIY